MNWRATRAFPVVWNKGRVARYLGDAGLRGKADEDPTLRHPGFRSGPPGLAFGKPEDRLSEGRKTG